MKYRIYRQDIVRSRAKWLSRMLLNLTPSIFDQGYSFEKAQNHLVQVMEEIQNSPYRKNGSRLILCHDSLRLLSKRSYPYVVFSIQSCNYD